MQPEVSVVVPVYNAGRDIDGLVRSLDHQSLPGTDLEVVLVDDGSTDGSLERVQRAAGSRPNVLVSTIAHSGWPGRPRNIGMDLAEGRYVFFADQDDEFFPEALQRMLGMAAAHGSDVVYGKVVRVGRNTPYWGLAKRNIGRADATEAVQSRTAHKLFRRQFLVDHTIRFPEGPVRLEDHNFMAQVLARQPVVSVLADYPCYRWIHRGGRGHASAAPVTPRDYWRFYAEVPQVAEQLAPGTELLDELRLATANNAFRRFAARSYLDRDEARRAALFDAVHSYVAQQVPESLDERLPILKRLRVKALRSGDRAAFDALQELRAALRFDVSLHEAAWEEDQLRIAVRAAPLLRGSPLLFQRVDDDLVLPLSELVPSLPGATCRLPIKDVGTIEVTVRHTEVGTEWPVHGTSRIEVVPTDAHVAVHALVDAVIDPQHGYFGTPLVDGLWETLTRVQFLGEGRVGSTRSPPSAPVPGTLVTVGDRGARVIQTSRQLRLELARAPALDRAAAEDAGKSRWPWRRA